VIFRPHWSGTLINPRLFAGPIRGFLYVGPRAGFAPQATSADRPAARPRVCACLVCLCVSVAVSLCVCPWLSLSVCVSVSLSVFSLLLPLPPAGPRRRHPGGRLPDGVPAVAERRPRPDRGVPRQVAAPRPPRLPGAPARPPEVRPRPEGRWDRPAASAAQVDGHRISLFWCWMVFNCGNWGGVPPTCPRSFLSFGLSVVSSSFFFRRRRGHNGLLSHWAERME